MTVAVQNRMTFTPPPRYVCPAGDQFLHAPHVIRQARFHRGRDAQGLMHAAEIILREMQRDGRHGHTGIGARGTDGALARRSPS